MLGRPVALALRARLSRCILEQSPTIDLTAARTVLVRTVRHYATPGRPRTAVGEPSKPVKRAVKRATAKPATATGDGKQEVKATRTANSTTSTSKKAAPKKKKQVLTAEERQIKADKAKAAAAKVKARKEGVKARGKAQATKDKIMQLKKTALEPPDVYGGTAFIAYSSSRVKEHFSDKRNVGLGQPVAFSAKQNSTKFAEEWKNMAPADIEHWNHVSRTQKEADEAKYKSWLESHKPDEIASANIARRALNRKFPTSANKLPKWRLIRDERQAKRPKSPYVHYCVTRHSSGDFANIALPDRMKLISKEWRALSDEEKKKYSDLGQEDKQRYVAEYTSVHNSPPARYTHDIPQAAATAVAAA